MEQLEPNAAPRGRPGRQRSPRVGITLLGVGASLAVLALLAVLAIPGFFARPSVTLDNAARLLVEDLAAAQNLAVYLRRPIAVEFTETGYASHEVLPTRASGVTGPKATPRMRDSDRERLTRSYERFGIFEGVTLGAFDLGADDRLVFGLDGQIDETSQLTVHFQGERRVVRIWAPDGLTEIRDPDQP